MKIQVFDPPMCCSTGVCGPSVDPELVRFAADLEWVKGQGVAVERYNLSQQPAAFAKNRVVKKALAKEGNDCLPLILVDGAVVSRATYPTREALAGHAGLEWSPRRVKGGESRSKASPCCGGGKPAARGGKQAARGGKCCG